MIKYCGNKILEEIADIFDTLSNPKRIQMIYGFSEGTNNSEILEECGFSNRQAMQRHVEVLTKHGLLDGAYHGSYKLTRKGKNAVAVCRGATESMEKYLAEDPENKLLNELKYLSEKGDIPKNVYEQAKKLFDSK